MHTPARPANSRRCATAAVVGLVTVWLLALSTPPAAAHPLGNFTINTYAGLRVAPDVVAIDFVVDLAEVATTQSRGFADTDGDGQLDPGEWADYARAGCGRWASEIRLVEQDAPLDLRVVDVGHEVQPGEGGVPTLRVECALDAARRGEAGPARIVFTDTTFPDQQGWREVTAVGDHATLTSSTVPVHSSSDRLTAYPDAGLEDPVDVRTAELLVEPGGPAAPTPAAAGGDGTAAATILGADGWVGALNRSVGARLHGEGMVAVAVLAAIALGTLHALAPGHGKTVIAAYLIGQRGSLSHAGALALGVVLTHTAGVLVLGAGLGLWTASVAAPERLYPLLGVTSGAIITGIGVSLLLRHRRPHHHTQHPHHHDPPRLPRSTETEPLRARSVVALGFAGGLVPTPSALLVLLGALTVGRPGLGILLVACYGVGMAIALVVLGVALSHARGRLDRRLDQLGSARLHALSHALPRVTASLVTLAGVVVIARSAL